MYMKKIYYIEEICVCCGKPAEANSMLCFSCENQMNEIPEKKTVNERSNHHIGIMKAFLSRITEHQSMIHWVKELG